MSDTNKKAAGGNGGPNKRAISASYTSNIANAADIERSLRTILAPGQITEVRALEATSGTDRRPQTYSGYFNDPAKLAAEVTSTLKAAKGIYFVPNPVHEGLLARAVNRLRPCGRDPTTADGDVTSRRWLLIDLDPVRPSGISASDPEHEEALARRADIMAHLTERGWPDPIEADSGNGGHLMYLIDLPADDEKLVERCLAALDQQFSDDVVKVDTTTHNPSRLWKLYGTRAGKGDDAGDTCGRPHRFARLLRVPDQVIVVSREQLEALASPPPPAPVPTRRPPKGPTLNGRTFDIADWINRSGLVVRGPEAWNTQSGVGRRWQFEVCPWNPAHTNGSAYLVQLPSGAIEAGCHHNGCSGRDWHGLRDVVEPGWRHQRAHGVFSRKPSGGSRSETPAGPPAEWPVPQALPPELPPVFPFDFDLLAVALRPWVRDIAERVQCPPDFPAVGAMIGLAGIVGRKVGIRPKRHDDWLVVPNLWGMVIGRPGIMKTPALQEPLKPLKRLEIAAKESYDEAVEEYELLQVVSDQGREVAKRKVRERLARGEDPGAVAASLRGSAQSDGTVPDAGPPVRRRYLVNDSSVEKLGEILNQNRNGVTIYRDELVGLLKSLDKEGQEGARSFYLEAWNGTGRYTYDRIGRGTLDIDCAVVSVIGGVQPGPLSEYLRGAAQNGAGDDGLLQRFQLAVWPDISRDWRNVDRWPDGDARKDAYALFERLDQITAEGIGAAQDPDHRDGEAIPYLRFDPTAQDLFDRWRAKLEAAVRSADEHPAIESHLAKYRSLVPSLALLCHLADVGRGAVGVESLQRAIRWADYLESHARRIFSPAVLSANGSARALAAKLRSKDLNHGFALKDIYHNGWSRLSTSRDAAAAVEILVDLDWLFETVEGGTGGRNRTRYWINPKIGLAAGGADTLVSPVPAETSKNNPEVAFGSSGGGGPGQFAAAIASDAPHIQRERGRL
jgi:putative DNA primase/helicase